MRFVTFILISCLPFQTVFATESRRATLTDAEYKAGVQPEKPPFGGPTSPGGTIEEIDRRTDPAFRFPVMDDAFDGWDGWKARLFKDTGIQLGFSYASLYQRANESSDGGSLATSSGFLRATMRWVATGRNTANRGTLNVMLDHRHRYRDKTPADLAGEVGYIGVTGLFFNDMKSAVINLNWQQGFNEGRTGLIVGRYDPNDYQGVLGYANPQTVFSNLTSSLDTSVALPDSSWGVGAGHWFNDQFYLLGGVNDANGFGADDLEFFDGGNEFYTYAHLGWSPSKDDRYFKNVHVLLWHVDERVNAGVPESEGISLAVNWTFDQRWMPFARIGFSSGDAPISNEEFTVGFIRKFFRNSDLFGLAISRGSPPGGLRDQTTVESFWRFQFSENFAITPSVQLLIDPALNPTEDQVWLFGLRTRLTL